LGLGTLRGSIFYGQGGVSLCKWGGLCCGGGNPRRAGVGPSDAGGNSGRGGVGYKSLPKVFCPFSKRRLGNTAAGCLAGRGVGGGLPGDWVVPHEGKGIPHTAQVTLGTLDWPHLPRLYILSGSKKAWWFAGPGRGPRAGTGHR